MKHARQKKLLFFVVDISKVFNNSLRNLLYWCVLRRSTVFYIVLRFPKRGDIRKSLRYQTNIELRQFAFSGESLENFRLQKSHRTPWCLVSVHVRFVGSTSGLCIFCRPCWIATSAGCGSHERFSIWVHPSELREHGDGWQQCASEISIWCEIEFDSRKPDVDQT